MIQGRNQEVEVYRFDRYDSKGNSHTVGREQVWELVRDSRFEDLEKANDYVVSQNRRHHAVDLGLVYLNLKEEDSVEVKEEKLKQIRARCLNDPETEHKRSYFVGKPNVKTMKKKIANEGLRVL